MNNVECFIIIAVVSCLLYFLNEKRVDSCTFILSIALGVETLFLMINSNRWDVEIKYNTIYLLLESILFVFLGEKAAKVNIIFTNEINQTFEKDFQRIPKCTLFNSILFTAISAFTFILYYRHISLYVTGAGFNLNFFSVLKNSKISYSESDTVQMGSILAYLYPIMKYVAYYFTYIIIYNILYAGKIECRLWFLPVLIYFISLLLSPGRLGVIKYLINIGFIFYYLNEGKKAQKKQVYVYVVLIFFVFILLNVLTMYRKDIYNSFEYLSVYLGAPIVALNEYINSNVIIDKEMECLRALSPFLKLFSSKWNLVTYNFDPCYFATSEGELLYTNVFTSLRRYHHDFGYIGCFLVCSIFGYFYTKCYLYVKNTKYPNHVVVVFLGTILYTLFTFYFEEEFLNSVISFSSLISIIYLYCFFKYFTYYEKKELRNQ